MKIKIRVNGNIPPHAKGQIVEVEVDMDGTPLDLQWRRRLKDAKEDKCCEVVSSRPAKKAVRNESAKRSKTS